MDTNIFFIILLATIMHAIWNAMVKHHPDKAVAVSAIVLGHLPLCIFCIIYFPLPGKESIPFLIDELFDSPFKRNPSPFRRFHCVSLFRGISRSNHQICFHNSLSHSVCHNFCQYPWEFLHRNTFLYRYFYRTFQSNASFSLGNWIPCIIHYV